MPPFSVLQSRDDALGRFSQSVGDEAPKRDTRVVTLRYVKMINGINPPFSKKRRVKTFLQRVTDYRRSIGGKKEDHSPPPGRGEEKRNEIYR